MWLEKVAQNMSDFCYCSWKCSLLKCDLDKVEDSMSPAILNRFPTTYAFVKIHEIHDDRWKISITQQYTALIIGEG